MGLFCRMTFRCRSHAMYACVPISRAVVLLLVAVWFPGFVGQSAAQSIAVIGADGHATSISAAQIASATHVTVIAEDHGAAARFEGVPLAQVLTMAGVPLGDSLHGTRLAEVLLVSATDNYKVAFALAEADPAFAVREIILADKRDGKPLDAKEGPFRIVAPGDKRPARWIRQVTELRVMAVK